MGLINLSSDIVNDEYTEYVYQTYDIQNKKNTNVAIPMYLGEINNQNWNVGLIVGNSGSGKTTILKNYGIINEPVFNNEKSLISNFNWLSPKEATHLLTSMGLSSVPTWLRPYKTLSNGEQYRARMAYMASKNDNDVILIDEYTSVVDRDVAKAMSYALHKYIRKHNKKIILASCHFDIIDWLMPDWIYTPENGGVLEKGDYLRQGRPKIQLQVSRVEAKTWDIFKKHHYLTEMNNKAYSHYLFEWNDKPVGIVVVSPLPSGTIKNAFRGSRTVVLPDYQGMGIGSSISDFIAGIYKSINRQYYVKTVNPALGEYRNKSNHWIGTPDNGKIRKDRKAISNYHSHWKSKKRISYCHKYIGKPIYGYEDLMLPVNELRKKYELNLFD